MNRTIEIEETENGFILREASGFTLKETYVFNKFDDLVEWIKEVLNFGNDEE